MTFTCRPYARPALGRTNFVVCLLVVACSADPGNGETLANPVSKATQAVAPAREVTAAIGDMGNGAGAISLDRNEQRRMATPAELEQFRNQRARLGLAAPASGVPPQTMTARALGRASALAPNTRIDVGIVLPDVAFDFSRLQDADDTARAALVDERKSSLKASQSAMEKKLASIGAVVKFENWLVNVIDAEISASQIAIVASWPEVAEISYSPDAIGKDNHLGWTGRNFRDGILTQPFINAGYDGNLKGRSNANAPVRVGVIESGTQDYDLVLRNHVGFKDSPTTASRVQKVYKCNPTCTLTSATGGGDNHGTQVTWCAAGSIEEGQDPSFTGSSTSAQRDRSGIGKEVDVYYYLGGTSAGMRNAINQAVADGVDVINMSWPLARCDAVDTATYDDSSINAALRSASNSGVLAVKSAGNDSHAASTCTIHYPAWRPEALSVASLDTQVENGFDQNTIPLLSSSSRGGAVVRVIGDSSNHLFSGIGLAAAGYVNHYFYAETAQYNTVDPVGGTSFAAPVVAGAAALMRHALNGIGWPGNDAKILLVNMLLHGDAWDPDITGDRSTGVSQVSGFGRIHAHWPSSTNLTGPWGWGTQSRLIHTGEILSWTVWDSGPESSAVTQWKWALTWFDSDLSAASDIVIYVTDSCHGNVSVNSDYSFDFRKRLHLRASNIGGKCLVMNAYAYGTPAAGTTFYTADYFHSGNADLLH